VADVILVLNAGSSSLKFALFDAGTLRPEIIKGEVANLGADVRFRATDADGEAIAGPSGEALSGSREQVLERIVDWLDDQVGGSRTLAGVGHRVVHGGTDYDAPAVIDRQVLEDLTGLETLAPLHQPYNLEPVRHLRRARPELTQVACFDTAFHRSQPPVAQWFALPRHYRDEGVLRYGFHGLSYEYIARVLPEYDQAAAAGRTIVAHLGHGASLCALEGGRSIATTMGFTALDGLPMGRRCGALDPGVVIHLIREQGLSADAVEDLLYRQSGLLGVSGISDDMHALLDSDDPAAGEAVDLFCYRTVRSVGSLAAALGGLDALVFTAGIGEHAPAVRERVCAALSWLDLRLDQAANDAGKQRISTAESQVAAWVIPTDEERMIAEHTLALLRGA